MSSSSLVRHGGRDSMLLHLPAELRNYIFELSMTSDTAIMLRAEKVVVGERNTLRFHPALPAIGSVCRQLHAEIPMASYYANNTFLFSDSMFQPNVLSAFRAIHGPAIESMARIKIFHCPKFGDLAFNIRLTATLSPKLGINLTQIQTSAPPTVRVAYYMTLNRDKKPELCYCFIKDVVESVSKKEQKSGKLFQFVVSYFEAMSKKGMDRDVYFCWKCQRIQAIDRSVM